MSKELRTFMSDNIGQMREEIADKEVERMNKQTNSNDWHKDYSPVMFVEDEIDENMNYPCVLNDGYCWVTCTKNDKTN